MDATKSNEQRKLLEAELEAVGIRLNTSPPDGTRTSGCRRSLYELTGPAMLAPRSRLQAQVCRWYYRGYRALVRVKKHRLNVTCLVQINNTVKLTKIDERMIKSILQSYKSGSIAGNSCP